MVFKTKKKQKKQSKKIKSIFKKFLQKIKDNNIIPNNKKILKWSNLEKQESPKIDDVLSIFKRNKKIIKATSKFFDKLFEQSKFDYYA